MASVTERKTPIEQALDLFFYAPLGLLMNAEEVVPQLVERAASKWRWRGCSASSRSRQGTKPSAERLLNRVQQLAEQFDAGSGGPSSAGRERRSPCRQHRRRLRLPRRQHNGEVAADARHPGLRQPLGVAGRAPARGLSAGELDAVAAYESANRGRKTILNKIAQLKS